MENETQVLEDLTKLSAFQLGLRIKDKSSLIDQLIEEVELLSELKREREPKSVADCTKGSVYTWDRFPEARYLAAEYESGELVMIKITDPHSYSKPGNLASPRVCPAFSEGGESADVKFTLVTTLEKLLE